MNLPVTAGEYALMFYCKFNRNCFDICYKTTNWLRNHEERSSDVSLVWHGYHVSLWRWECFCIISSISIFPYRAPWADLVSTSPRSSEVPGWHVGTVEKTALFFGWGDKTCNGEQGDENQCTWVMGCNTLKHYSPKTSSYPCSSICSNLWPKKRKESALTTDPTSITFPVF